MPDRAESQPQEFLVSHYQTAVHNSRRATQEQRSSELEEHRLSLQQDPRNAEAYIELASCYKSLGQYAEALSVLGEGVERCPPGKDLYRAYISRLQQANRIEEAIRAANQCQLLLPDAGYAELAKRLTLPVLYDTQEEVDHYRRRYQAELAAFCRETVL